MEHEVFEVESDEQKWDSGCWIRYKLFERVVNSIPSDNSRDIAEYWKERALSAERTLTKLMKGIEEVSRT